MAAPRKFTGKATPATPNAVQNDDSEKRGHPVLMALAMDGETYAENSIAFVSATRFAELKAAQVFKGDWADGEQPPESPVP